MHTCTICRREIAACELAVLGARGLALCLRCVERPAHRPRIAAARRALAL